jgi:hypothetical protein
MLDGAISTRTENYSVAVELAERLAAAVTRSTLEEHRFEHIYMTSVFTPTFYGELLGHLPSTRRFHPLRHRDAVAADGSSTRLRMYLYPERVALLPGAQRAIWMPVARALRSTVLQEAIKQKFQRSLESRFQRPVASLRFYPIAILVRDRPGYRIGIHADALSKAITVQYYLPRDDGQRHLGTVFHDGRDGEAARRTKHLSFLPASGYAFAVMPRESWHSVPRTRAADGDRHSIMLTYYVQDTAKLWLERRYDRCRSFFGLGPRG